MARSQSAALPDFIPPELATLTDKAPAGDAWLHEIKLDGYRTAARLEAGKVRMLTRSGLDWTARFRPIAAALAALKIRAAYLDGEIAVLGEDGVTSFAALQDALSRGQGERLTYHVFDLLHLDGRDLTGLPLIERKALLAPLIARLPKGRPGPLFRSCAGPGAEASSPRPASSASKASSPSAPRRPIARAGPRTG